MTKVLQVVQAKPNPAGKDKTSTGQAKPQQLLGEWVDLKNVGTEAIPFASMNLFDVTFDSRCEPTNKLQNYWTGDGNSSLSAGQVVRVHTGKLSDKPLMDPADRDGVDWHGYAGRDNFVLNNRCGDTITVSWQVANDRIVSDSASYKPNPPEGVVLSRFGNDLVYLKQTATGF